MSSNGNDAEASTRAGGEEEEEEDDEEGSVSSVSTTDSSAGKKKKKKKTKKKKKGNAATDDAAEGGGPQPDNNNNNNNNHGPAISKSKGGKGENDKKFNAALEAARQGELWVDLSCSSLQQAKARKLFDTLKGNDTVTSVDLSGNQINDEGAQAIAGVLGLGGMPSLLELDLRDNPLTDEGLKVLEGLQKMRRKPQLYVKTGSLKAPEPAPPVRPPTPSKEIKEVSKGKMFRKFFQTGDDDDDEGSMSQQESTLDDRGINPAELWDEIKDQQRQGSLAGLTAKLQQLCTLLQRETQAIQSPNNNVLDGSKPHIKECVANLQVLSAVLCIAPRRLILQCSPELLATVGSHRVAAAEALALLTGPNNTSIDRAVAAAAAAAAAPVAGPSGSGAAAAAGGAGLVARALHVALAHPLCSALHVRALRLLRSCLSSSVPDLAAPLLTHGWGAGLPDPFDGSSQPEGEGAREVAPEPCRPLPEVLAAAATSVVSVPSGSRSAVMGFVLELCKAFKEASGAPPEGQRNAAVAAALEGSEVWRTFAADGGPLSSLLSEQSGELCGPRPMRPPVEEGSEMAEMAGGGLLSGREILALLQGMSAMGVMS